MKIEELSALFEKDLRKMSSEISSYNKEPNLWKTETGISNSGGNLCLHVIGNLKHFVGFHLGNIPYSREREREFTDRGIPVVTLLKCLDETLEAVSLTLSKMPEEMLNQRYPVDVFGKEMSTGYFLLHLYGHLNYYLGQLNYHRRMLDK
jgi:hypothetical protein